MLVTCYNGDMLSRFVSNIDVLETSTAQIPAIKLYKKLGYECDRTWFDMNSLSLDFAYWGLGISCTACYKKLKGSSDPNHFIFEINAGKSRIRHGTTLNLSGIIFN